MEPTTTEVIVDALKRASEAHGIYEAKDLGGVFDEHWPQWYAVHMVATLEEAGYRLVRAE